MARGSSDQFRPIIDQGEKFLAQRPKSTQRVSVLFAVAAAYETWWALSQASDDDPYVTRDAYRDGADAARRKAIQYYEQVIRFAPQSQEAIYARRQLPRLRLGLDTGQRRFFCVHD